MKKQRMMMGDMEDELRNKIEEMDEVNTANKKFVNVKEFKKNKEAAREKEQYM